MHVKGFSQLKKNCKSFHSYVFFIEKIIFPFICPDVSVGGASVGQAFAGDSAILTLSGLEPEELHVGAFLTDPALPMPHVARMRARVVLFNITVPLIKGSMVRTCSMFMF